MTAVNLPPCSSGSLVAATKEKNADPRLKVSAVGDPWAIGPSIRQRPRRSWQQAVNDNLLGEMHLIIQESEELLRSLREIEAGSGFGPAPMCTATSQHKRTKR